MRTLNHPAVQKGLSSGRFNNTPTVTEMIDGESMRDVLQKKAPYSGEDAVSPHKKNS